MRGCSKDWGDLHTIGSILLTILKIIGICILAILAVLLLILLTLLFVPIRYRSTGKLGKEEKEVTAKVSWLASAVSATAVYRDGKAGWAVKLFGIQILPKKKTSDDESETEKAETSDGEKDTGKRETFDSEKDTGKIETSGGGNGNGKRKASDGEKDTGKEKTSDSGYDAKKKVRQRHGRKKEEKEKPKESKEAEELDEPEETNKSDEQDEQRKQKEQAAPPSLFERIFRKISYFFAGIRERFGKIREQVSGIFERIKNFQIRLRKTKKKLEQCKKFYYLDETQVTLGVLKTELKKLIRYVLPTRIRANIHFGFEDPADTGVTLGTISAFYGFFPKGICLEPDFEEKVLEGEWKFRGRIRLGYFIRLAIRLVCRRENRVTLRRIRRLLK